MKCYICDIVALNTKEHVSTEEIVKKVEGNAHFSYSFWKTIMSNKEAGIKFQEIVLEMSKESYQIILDVLRTFTVLFMRFILRERKILPIFWQ